MPWRGARHLGDDVLPHVFEIAVEFNLGNDVKENCHAYLSMMTRDVKFDYNELFINGERLGKLHIQEDSWGYDAWCLGRGCVVKGSNILKVTSRNYWGEAQPMIDRFYVRDPLLIYAVE